MRSKGLLINSPTLLMGIGGFHNVGGDAIVNKFNFVMFYWSLLKITQTWIESRHFSTLASVTRPGWGSLTLKAAYSWLSTHADCQHIVPSHRSVQYKQQRAYHWPLGNHNCEIKHSLQLLSALQDYVEFALYFKAGGEGDGQTCRLSPGSQPSPWWPAVSIATTPLHRDDSP